MRPFTLLARDGRSGILGILLFLLALPPGACSEEFSVQGDPGRGKGIYTERGCSICHSIERVGGAIGPDLTQVTVRRTDKRLVKWLSDPPALLKDTDMPKAPWKSEQEIFDLIAYFKTFRKEINRDFLGKVSKKEAGRRLVEEYDCKGCHRIKAPESGRERFPDLSREGRKRSKEWLDTWLKDPQAVKPGTFMPTYPLSDEERGAIVEYLSTLR